MQLSKLHHLRMRAVYMYMFVVLENSNSSVAKTKRRVSVRYGCSDSSKLMQYASRTLIYKAMYC